MLNSKIAVIVTEGETDDLFYRRILDVLRKKTLNKRLCVDKVEYICLKGFGKFDSKLCNILKRKVRGYKKINKDVEVSVFLCYDQDVFVGKKNPPINWRQIEKELKRNKADYIYHIVAEQSIEDFIMLDFDGILKFLNLRNLNQNDYRGCEGLKRLFKKAGKAYIKGSRAESLLNAINFDIIEEKMCIQIKPLCCIVGVNCSHSDF